MKYGVSVGSFGTDAEEPGLDACIATARKAEQLALWDSNPIPTVTRRAIAINHWA